jgi:hypothetical protein
VADGHDGRAALSGLNPNAARLDARNARLVELNARGGGRRLKAPVEPGTIDHITGSMGMAKKVFIFDFSLVPLPANAEAGPRDRWIFQHG